MILHPCIQKHIVYLIILDFKHNKFEDLPCTCGKVGYTCSGVLRFKKVYSQCSALGDIFMSVAGTCVKGRCKANRNFLYSR